MLRIAGLMVFLGAVAGCMPRTVQIEAPPGVSAGEAPAEMDWSDWGLTLSRVVVGDRVDFAALVRDHQPLDRFLFRVSRLGPTTTPDHFPDRPSRLAYFINCHNAVVLRGVVEVARQGRPPARVPEDLETVLRFAVDGRWQSAADLRRAAESLAGNDWRVSLTLFGAGQSGPPLWPRVFLGEMLDAQLNNATRSALQSPQVVRVEHGEEKRLVVWSGIFGIKDRLVRDYEERLGARNATLFNVLLEWADEPQRRILNGAVGYSIVPMLADLTLNDVQPAPTQEKGLSAVLRSIRSITFLRP